MKLTNLFKSALCVLGAVGVVACSGGSSCPPGQQTNGTAVLTLVAPNLYPVQAGSAGSIAVRMNNSGTRDATGLTYTVSNNTTGGDITISAASQSSCANISAHSSCPIVVQIAATPPSHTGSFTIVATSSSSSGLASKLSNEVKSLFSKTQAAEARTFTASVGLVDLPDNNGSGINALTPYYPSAIIANATGDTNVIVSVAVS